MIFLSQYACQYCGIDGTRQHERSHTERWVCGKCPELRYSSTSSVNNHLHTTGHRMVLLQIAPEPMVRGAALLSDPVEVDKPCVVPLRHLVLGVSVSTQTDVFTAVVDEQFEASSDPALEGHLFSGQTEPSPRHMEMPLVMKELSPGHVEVPMTEPSPKGLLVDRLQTALVPPDVDTEFQQALEDLLRDVAEDLEWQVKDCVYPLVPRVSKHCGHINR